MIQSRGSLVVYNALGNDPTYTRWYSVGGAWSSAFLWASYAAMYRLQPWVHITVKKLARLHARVPIKGYERGADGRQEVPDHPYSRLLRRPNPKISRALFWAWVSATWDLYGEAILVKLRDPRSGVPVELWPLHPSYVEVELRSVVVAAGVVDAQLWYVAHTEHGRAEFPERDVIHLRSYNPDDLWRGMSWLEPLRRTLEHDDAARRATSSFWKKGARPGFVLQHPKNLSEPAQKRLTAQFEQAHAGADNTGSTVVLEEGMEAKPLSLSAVEAQYIESRKLNIEEVVAAADLPPTAVHILDHATYSNVTENLRSVYRDTVAPRLGEIEATLELQLEPDFDGDVYAEFLLDEVLRGDFEKRVEAYSRLHQMGWPLNDLRSLENRPPVPGGDVPRVNGALVPLREGADTEFARSELDRANAVGQLVRAGFDPEAAAEAVGLPRIPHTGRPPVTVQVDEAKPPAAVRSVRQANGDGVMVALFVPAETAERLAVDGGDSADRLHVTLAMLADDAAATDLDFEVVSEAVAAFAAGAAELRGVVSGVGRFNGDGEQAVYASVDIPELAAWRQELVDALAEAGVDVNAEHGFSPHITLAYVDDDEDSPVEQVQPIPLRFQSVTLAWGAEWTHYMLQGRSRLRSRRSS